MTLKNTLLLSFCLIVGAATGAVGRFDFFWDFLNYHFHNPWAFLSGRVDDVAPASVNTFFNPLPDLPLWFLIKRFNGCPALIYGIQGLWFGVLLFVFIKFARLSFSGNTAADYAKTALAAALAATGQATFFQIGSSTNEIQMAVFVMTAFYFSAKWILNPDLQDWKKFAFLGVFFGFGLGLKPTVLPYCAASAVNAVARLRDGNVAVRTAVCCFWIVLCGVFLTTPVHSFPWDKNRAGKYVDIEIPAELPERFLLKLYGFPTAGVAPVWAAAGRDFKIAAYHQFNTVSMTGSDFADRGLFRRKRDEIERGNTLPIVIVYRLPMGENAAKVLDGVDLSGFSCRELKNNLDPLLNVCLPEK